MSDITYCSNRDCPFTDCFRHPIKLKGREGTAYFAPLGGECKRYISWLVDKVENNV